MSIKPLKHRLRPQVYQAQKKGKQKRITISKSFKKKAEVIEHTDSPTPSPARAEQFVYSTPVIAGKLNANANVFIRNTAFTQLVFE